MGSELVSVIVPTFNSSSYLQDTIASILGQTHQNLEIQLVDDGSTDDTREVVRSLDNRVHYTRQDNWGGPSRPRNVGISHAAGDFVAFFDSDDLMHPTKIADALEVLRREPEVGLVFSDFQVIDEKGDLLSPSFLAGYRNFRSGLQSRDSSPWQVLAGNRAYTELLQANFVGTSSVVCRREALTAVGPFDESMLNADDVDMWRRLAYHGFAFAYLDKVLHSYRKRGGGISGRGLGRYPAILRGLEKQMDLDLDSSDRSLLHGRIKAANLGFASALRDEGRFDESRAILSKHLTDSPSLKGFTEYLKTLVLEMKSRVVGA